NERRRRRRWCREWEDDGRLKRMTRQRPCRICRRRWQPHAGPGDRQRVGSDDECQRERHRRSCRRWREENREEEQADRLRAKLREPPPPPPRAPMAGLRLEAVRDAVGPQMAVIIEETGEVLAGWVRDAVNGQGMEMIEIGRASWRERV